MYVSHEWMKRFSDSTHSERKCISLFAIESREISDIISGIHSFLFSLMFVSSFPQHLPPFFLYCFCWCVNNRNWWRTGHSECLCPVWWWKRNLRWRHVSWLETRYTNIFLSFFDTLWLSYRIIFWVFPVSDVQASTFADVLVFSFFSFLLSLWCHDSIPVLMDENELGFTAWSTPWRHGEKSSQPQRWSHPSIHSLPLRLHDRIKEHNPFPLNSTSEKQTKAAKNNRRLQGHDMY